MGRADPFHFGLFVVACSVDSSCSPRSLCRHFFVTSIAAAAYFAKVTGMSDVVIAGRKVPLIRYIDWIATTPLMLFELCVIGGAETLGSKEAPKGG